MPHVIIGRALFLVVLTALGLATAGCTTNPATGRSSFTGFMSPGEEAKVGADEHPKILQEFGGAYENPQVTRYVQQVGERLAHNSELPETRFTFTVLNSDIVNAFALPGGYVYITRALLALASSEAEMAGVLGHEIGHVAARHTAERYSAAVASQGLLNIGAIAVGILTGSSAASQAVGEVGGLGAGAFLAGYSRDQELEADMLGVRYLAKTGFEEEAMASFLEKMQMDSALSAQIAGRPADEFDMFQSHPRTSDRVRAAIEQAKKQGLDTANPRVGRDDYLDIIDGMAWGGDRKSGWAVNQSFIHPDLRVRFEVPKGFRIVNSETAVNAIGPNKARIVFNGVARDRAGRSAADGLAPADYMRRVWARNLQLSNVESITINGLEAATAAAKLSTKDGQMDARLVVVRVDARNVYRFLFVNRPQDTAALNTPFRTATYSFRILNEREAREAQPPRIRIVRVGPGDTAESLARRMTGEDYPLERFRVLNGLKEGQQPRAGDRVKIIAER